MKLETDTLDQKTRLEKVLNHEEPDRVPCFLMGMPEYGDFFQEFISREDELLDEYTENPDNLLITPSGDYTIDNFFGTDIINKGIRVIEPTKIWVDEEGNYVDHGTMVNGVEVGRYIDRSGRLWNIKILDNGFPYSWYAGGFLKTREEIYAFFDRFGWPHERKVIGFGSDFNETNKNYKDHIHLIPGFGPGLFEFSWFMMGLARWMYHVRKNPDLIHQIIESIKEYQIMQVEKMKSVHPLACFRCDDMGQKGRALISEDLHRKFFFEARKEVNDAIHDIGAKSILHSCGNIVSLLPDLIESGVDGWQTLEPASGIDFNLVKQKYGDKLSFWGAIDNNVLSFGTPEKVENQVTTRISQLASGGGYVIGPAHDYLDVKVDLALVLKESIIKHAKRD